MKILIVDDEFPARQYLLSLLQDNHECHLAMNGEDAIDLFNLSVTSSKPFDVILLDLVMPIMNGHQVISKVREIEEDFNIKGNRKVKIVVTSAKDDADHKLRCIKGGADKYITKPILPKKLLSILKSFIVRMNKK